MYYYLRSDNYYFSMDISLVYFSNMISRLSSGLRLYHMFGLLILKVLPFQNLKSWLLHADGIIHMNLIEGNHPNSKPMPCII